MSLAHYLSEGQIIPGNKTWKEKLSCFLGRRKAMKHQKVEIDKAARISPDAYIHPRKGEIHIGPDSSVAQFAAIQGNVTIGRNSSVQRNTMVVGCAGKPGDEGWISIGDNVRIAGNCMLIASDHVFSDVNKPITEQGSEPGTIIIEDNVWLGGGVHVNHGVTIGTGSVIGAGSVVTRDIPPYSVAVGVPCRVIKNRLEQNNNK